jgi:signal peptidase I
MQKVQNFAGVLSVIEKIDSAGKYDPYIFPHNPRYPWNNDNFGPLTIPKKGVTIHVDTSNLCLYDRVIQVYDGNKLEVKNGKIFINDIETDSYTFKQDYYFMMGDNRHNSADSRSWGLVPFDHVVGKPLLIWFSMKDPEKNPISGKGFILNTGGSVSLRM